MAATKPTMCGDCSSMCGDLRGTCGLGVRDGEIHWMDTACPRGQLKGSDQIATAAEDLRIQSFRPETSGIPNTLTLAIDEPLTWVDEDGGPHSVSQFYRDVWPRLLTPDILKDIQNESCLWMTDRWKGDFEDPAPFDYRTPIEMGVEDPQSLNLIPADSPSYSVTLEFKKYGQTIGEDKYLLYTDEQMNEARRLLLQTMDDYLVQVSREMFIGSNVETPDRTRTGPCQYDQCRGSPLRRKIPVDYEMRGEVGPYISSLLEPEYTSRNAAKSRECDTDDTTRNDPVNPEPAQWQGRARKFHRRA